MGLTGDDVDEVVDDDVRVRAPGVDPETDARAEGAHGARTRRARTVADLRAVPLPIDQGQGRATCAMRRVRREHPPFPPLARGGRGGLINCSFP